VGKMCMEAETSGRTAFPARIRTRVSARSIHADFARTAPRSEEHTSELQSLTIVFALPICGQDVYGGGNFWENGVPRKNQDTCFRTFYTRGFCPNCTPAVPADVVFQNKP